MKPAVSERLKRAQDALSCHRYQGALSEAEIALAELEESGENADLRSRAYQVASGAAVGLGDFTLAEEYVDQALMMLNGSVHLPAVLNCQLTLATCRLHHGDLDQARYLINTVRAQTDPERYPELAARSLIQLGNLCWLEGNLQRAIEHLTQAVQACDDAELPLQANQARSSLGIALSMMGHSDEAEQMFVAALEFFQQEGDFIQAVRCLNNLAGIAFSRRDWSRAREYLLNCVILENDARNHPDLALSWFNLGLVEQRDGKSRLAKKYFLRSLQLAEQVGNRIAEARSLLQLGVAVLTSTETAEAVSYVKQAQMRIEDSRSSVARTLPWYTAICHLADNQLEAATRLWDARPPWPQSEDAAPLLELLHLILKAEFRSRTQLTNAAVRTAGSWAEDVAALITSADCE